jgi:hypothetical protein
MKKILPFAAACAFAAPALAQGVAEIRIEHVAAPDAPGIVADAEIATAKATAEAWRQWGDDLRASLGTMYGSRLSGKTVKGAPYSAEVITETNQTLADGNVISKKTSGRVYRDSEGRTRQETFVNGEAQSIQINDPVEGKSTMLLPGSRKAVSLPRIGPAHDLRETKVVRVGDKEIRVENGKVTVDGKETAGKVEINANGKEIRVENGKVWINGKEISAVSVAPRLVMKHVAEGDGPAREEVHVRVVRSGEGEGKDLTIGLPPLPPIPPMPANPAGSHQKLLDSALARAKGTTTSLGVKEFDGVKAEGRSTSQTIAAGEIGNRNPIIVTSETWYSPDLQVTVYSRQSDPRYGESIYRLANIRRAEPAIDLFKVPEEYSAGKRARG